jgi:hypothetical protein
MLPRSLAVLLALAVGACAYPGAVTGQAPDYPYGYQPAMGGYANDWPAQPGALWGPEDVPSVEVFFQPLAVHGRWVRTRWGQAFQPAAPRGWRPYVNGQWLDNRYWLSADPWGWATDHYGRWGFDEAIGWVWVPGTNWGPSWVAWREADEVVGWAPIPPQIAWNVGVGFGSGWGFDNFNSWYGPSWVWVPRGNLFAPRFGGRILPWNIGVNYWGRTRWQHTPYWGWNQPWDRGWGWRAPGRGFGQGYAYNQRGYPNYGRSQGWTGDPRRNGWNGDPRRNGWNGDPRRNGWGGDPRRDGWNGDPRRNGWNGDPRNGQPGSVGDRIGRDLSGQPQRPPQAGNGTGINNGNDPRRDGAGGDPRRDGWNGSARGDGRRNDMSGDGRRDGSGGDPRRGGWNGGGRPSQGGRPAAGLTGAVGGAMALPPQVQAQQQAQPQFRPDPGPRQNRDFTAQPRSEPTPRREPPAQRTEPTQPARESYRDERSPNPY